MTANKEKVISHFVKVVDDYAKKRISSLFYHSRFIFGDFIVEAREANYICHNMEVSISGPARPHGAMLESFMDGPVSFAVSKNADGHYNLTRGPRKNQTKTQFGRHKFLVFSWGNQR